MAQPHKYNRRHGPDFWVRSLTWFVAIGWLLLVAVFILLDKAKPVTRDLFDRWLNTPGPFRNSWDEQIVHVIFYCVLTGFIVSSAGIFVNKKRHRRIGDEWRWSLFFVLIVSFIGIITYLF